MELPIRFATGLYAPVVLTCAVFVAGCSGGSDGPDPSPPMATGTSSGNSPVPADALPDFLVVDWTTSASTVPALEAVVTVRNDGAGAAPVPDAWMLLGFDPDFTAGFHPEPVLLRPQDPSDPRLIEPGASQTFELEAADGALSLNTGILGRGQVYARLWLNPDRSVRTRNPESFVTPSYATPESDYENNLSDLATYEETREGERCAPDAFEPNDTLETATPIELGTRYDFNSCDDYYEVVAVELEADQTYEIVRFRSDTGDRTQWRFTIVEPDGRYLLRNELDGGLFTTRQAGTHHLVGSSEEDSGFKFGLSMEVRPR